MEASRKYNRDITGLDGVKTTVDVYRVLVAFDVIDPELQHAIKKLLCAGLRGKCDETQDIDEAIMSLEKFKERKGQESGIDIKRKDIKEDSEPSEYVKNIKNFLNMSHGDFELDESWPIGHVGYRNGKVVLNRIDMERYLKETKKNETQA